MSILFLLWPVCYDSRCSKFFSAPLEGTGTRNIPRHLVMILPNIGSLRLRVSAVFDSDAVVKIEGIIDVEDGQG